MNASQETSSCPAEQGDRKAGRKHQVPKDEVRSVVAYVRLSQSLSHTLQVTAAHWHIDESTLIYNILKFTTEKKRFTVE